MKSNSTRRDFVLRGGAALGAGAAATTAAAAAFRGKEVDAALHKPVEWAAEREAIRNLLLTTLKHTSYRQDSRQQMDAVVIGEGGVHASATFHVEAEVCTPIQGDCTAAQMARLQGNVASRHWESGRFDVKLAKTQGDWKIVSLRYERA